MCRQGQGVSGECVDSVLVEEANVDADKEGVVSILVEEVRIGC